MQQGDASGPPAAPSAPAPAVDAGPQPLPYVYPWRRFFARHLDIVLIAVVASVVIRFLFDSNSAIGKFERTSDVLAHMGSLVLLIPIEAALVAVFGTTFGKVLYGIRVEGRDQPKLDYRHSLFRAFQVWLRGMGLGIPIVSLVCMFLGYNRLMDTRTTTWDREAKTKVVHLPLGIVKVLALVVIWIGVLALSTSVFWS